MFRLVRFLLLVGLTAGLSLSGCNREDWKEWFFPTRKIDVGKTRTIVVVQVEKGDSIWKLVRRYRTDGATMEHTRSCNGIKEGESLIYPGQELLICGPEELGAAAPIVQNH